MTRKWWACASVVALAVVGSGAYWSVAQADTVTTIQVAIPTNVTVTKDSTQVVFIGKPTSISSVTCAPGTAHPQTVVAIDPGGANASQLTGVLAFHDHEVPLGSRYKITSDPQACSTDLRLYTAQLN